MLKKILQTIVSRYLIAFLNLILIFINAKVLGIEGVGVVGIILASINIAVIVNTVLCGNTIVYFMNRYDFRYVIFPAYAWILIGSALACGVMYVLGLFAHEYFMHIMLLSMLMSFVAANSRLLLGKDSIRAFNLTFILQGITLFVSVIVLYFVCKRQDVMAYLIAQYISNGVAFVVTSLLCLQYFNTKKYPRGESPMNTGHLIRGMFAYGLWSSADSLAENLTTRLNYFLLESFGGLSAVGLLDAGTRISESVWRISQSISLIEYSTIAGKTDKEEQRTIALKTFKLTFCALAGVMILILLIPEWVYTEWLFSHEFEGVRSIIVALSAGIIAFGSNSILGHYFIGSGRVRISTYCSVFGLLVLLLVGVVLIPHFGVLGAAITSSITFVSMLLFSITRFMKITHTCLREFLPTRTDLREAIALLRRKQ